MANIKVEISHDLINGQPITFVAPCNCNEITGLNVYYPGGSKVFTFKDAHGNALTGIGNLFSKGAYVKAILDVTSGSAYLQNADTNAYIEETFTKRIRLWVNPSPYSAFDPQELPLDLSGYDGVEVAYFSDPSTQSLCSTGFIQTDWRYFAYGVSSEFTYFMFPFHAYRQICFYKNKIEFFGTQFKSMTTTSGTTSEDNTFLVPYAIYGIKGVKK